MKTPTNLQFWVDKLKQGEKFSMARWGDGELYCMWGRRGQNSNGCKYYPELRADLIKAMEPRKGFYHGLQCVLPRDEARIMAEYPKINWHETECLSIDVAEGRLYPFIEELRKHKLVIIGNDSIKMVTADLLHWYEFISVPSSNAYDLKQSIMENILSHDTEGIVFLFSCGMAANAIISELHGKAKGTMIDVGHIWDPFTGLMSRCDLEGKTLSDIEKNLHP
jgi:hypothetical protein